MEENSILTLIPYLILALFPGIINAINAWEKLEKKFRIYIFFQPFKTFVFWVWLFIQILVPAVIYWWIFITTCPEKPNIDLYFVLKVVVYGISFSSLLTNIETQALIPVNVSIIINRVDRLLERVVQKKQLIKTANFWDSLEEEMKTSEDLLKGIKYLKDNYFKVKYNSTNHEKYQYFKTQLEEITKNKNTEELVSTCFKGIIPRQDLPEVLKKFKISDEFINKYFKQS
ncbi:MAG: hypothetical protein AB4060_12785 [Crocosphaera sp.]